MPLLSDKKTEAKLTKSEQDECLRVSQLMSGFFGGSSLYFYAGCTEATLERRNAGKYSPQNTGDEGASNGLKN